MQLIEGDAVKALQNGEVDTLVHQVNCQGKMNSGIAKQIREEFPEHYQDYLFVTSGDSPKQLLGHFIATLTEKGFIVGIFGQLNFGYDGKLYTSYSALANGLVTVAKDVLVKTIAVPYNLGCDRGGGNWVIVNELLLDVERNFDVEFKVYKL